MELAPIVERASIDEMYFDLTGCEVLYNNDLPGFIRKLQKIVWDEFHLPCTISLASNKVIAKIAAQTVKPAGTIYVPHGTEQEFLAPLSVDAIPGVGKKNRRGSSEERISSHLGSTEDIARETGARPRQTRDLDPRGRQRVWI